MTYNTLLVLLAVGLFAASTGVVGTFAVLRGRALLGDALAHAALPGLVAAFLLTGQKSLVVLLTGALASGLLGVATVSAIRRYTRVKEDTAVAIVLSVFFGAGVALSGVAQHTGGSGAKAGLDSFLFGKTAGVVAADVALIAVLAGLCLLLVVVLYKEFRLVTFDPQFAATQGWPAGLIDGLILATVSLTVVVGLPTVGVVLVAAFLILPAAAARFWTDRLGTMLVLAAVFGVVAATVGTFVSDSAEKLPAGPVITLAGTTLFLLSALFGARRGLLWRGRQSASFAVTPPPPP